MSAALVRAAAALARRQARPAIGGRVLDVSGLVVRVRCGPAATGDILARLGGHLLNAAERRRAEEEAEQARKDGAAFQ